MDLLIFGMQGSGKGTQGQMIADRYQMEIFETGAELRKIAQENSPLGKKVKKIIEAGHLVPAKIVMEIIENFMEKLPLGKQVLFDGIPREKIQARGFNTLMKKLGRDFKGILIKISEKEALKRLLKRRLCQKCKVVFPASYQKETCKKCGGKLVSRSDDTEKSIKTRLSAYRKETLPVIKDYQKQGKIIEIGGEKPIPKVTREVFKALDPIFQPAE